MADTEWPPNQDVYAALPSKSTILYPAEVHGVPVKAVADL